MIRTQARMEPVVIKKDTSVTRRKTRVASRRPKPPNVAPIAPKKATPYVATKHDFSSDQKIVQERIDEKQRDLELLKAGEQITFKQHVKTLEEKKHLKIVEARKYKIEKEKMAKIIEKSEKKQAYDEFELQKQTEFEKILKLTLDKLTELERERDELIGDQENSHRLTRKRQMSGSFGEKLKKIKFELDREEIDKVKEAIKRGWEALLVED
eukprot:TRINITY_DN12306_c0_g1_i1.p1 TRINITY_DN12306_c0_g1~~TRINITY_DN12306_c0_g1_i1.p1  ORF type:complete len:211 (+),score=60.06 TRINITY_DN12306_c0_g1_i1:49-681(+)